MEPLYKVMRAPYDGKNETSHAIMRAPLCGALMMFNFLLMYLFTCLFLTYLFINSLLVYLFTSLLVYLFTCLLF